MQEKLNKQAEFVCSLLRENGLTLSTAESCTGGMIAKIITDLAGVSDVFEGTVVSYSNDVKMKVLGVRKETLDTFGAVSEETAREMCIGVKAVLGTRIAVSVTGIAGPTGDTPENPIGTVCFGITSENGTETQKKFFGSTLSRDEIREAACAFALSLVEEHITKKELLYGS